MRRGQALGQDGSCDTNRPEQEDPPLIHHRNAALSYEARRRLVHRCQYRPISHVAAEAGVSRACLSKWVNRYRAHGEAGLEDRSSRPRFSPTQTPPHVIALIEQLRRQRKWSARLITAELHQRGHRISQSSVTRWLRRLGLNQRRHLDTDGTPTRTPGRIVARYPGHMVHIDVKKVGRIREGGGWWAHGRGSAQDKAKNSHRVGYSYLHSASTDTPGWPTPRRYPTKEPRPRPSSSTAPAPGSPLTASPP